MRIEVASEADAEAVAAVRTEAADDLTRRFGKGHWSWGSTAEAALRDIRTTRVLVARAGGAAAGTFLLSTRKPWAIDLLYFTPVPRALYLRNMAVAPPPQRQGVGRALIGEAISAARAWPAGAIRLDCYDAPAGAGPFYAKCGLLEVGRAHYRGTPLIYFEMVLL